ncbi:MAG: hypothetical protein WAV11_03335 [Minisyncoccia bacterium]
MINYDEFKKVEITIGKIISAEKMPNADKLLILKVDFGNKALPVVEEPKVKEGESEEKPIENAIPVVTTPERDIRQIVSGISAFFPEPEKLIGTQCAFVTNLEPRMIRGYQSNGMILAVGGENGEPFSLFRMGEEIAPGAQAR